MSRRDWSLSDRTKNWVAYIVFLLLMLLGAASLLAVVAVIYFLGESAL